MLQQGCRRLGALRRAVSSASFKPGQGSGDDGKSALFSLERRWKDDAVFEVLGTLDELSAHIGLCRGRLTQLGLFGEATFLEKVQCCVQDVGSHVATPPASSSQAHQQRTSLTADFWLELEERAGAASASLPPLRAFILAGGGEASGAVHVARAVCRRAERRLAPLVRDAQAHPHALRYLNRLAAEAEGVKELTYKNPRLEH